MRKGLILALVLLIGLCGITYAGIKTSKHDFSDVGTAGSVAVGYQGDIGGQVCRACHIPHKSLSLNSRFDQNLLWRQTYARGSLVTNNWSGTDYWYSEWSATTDDTRYRGIKRCLGCHDGGSFYLWSTYVGAGESTVAITRAAAITTNLQEVHPVGLDYNTAATVGLADFYAAPKYGGIKLDAGQYLGCRACHDPHNQTPLDNFVSVSMTGSSLCLGCHNK